MKHLSDFPPEEQAQDPPRKAPRSSGSPLSPKFLRDRDAEAVAAKAAEVAVTYAAAHAEAVLDVEAFAATADEFSLGTPPLPPSQTPGMASRPAKAETAPTDHEWKIWDVDPKSGPRQQPDILPRVG